MSNNSNPYMNQSMPLSVRGGCSCANPVQGQRTMQNDCGCVGSAAPTMPNGYAQRTAQNDCGCGNSGYRNIAGIPAGSRGSLLAYIDQVSFAAYEAALYLDTHADCQNGQQYFRDHNEKRNQALNEYAKLYGPLTLTQAGESSEAYWQWINQPWPWEGGNC